MRKFLFVLLIIFLTSCSSATEENEIYKSPTPTPTKEAQPVSDELKEEVLQAYKILIFIQANTNSLKETAEKVYSGELEGFESFGALITHAAMAEAVDQVIDEIEVPFLIKPYWNDALSVQESVKSMISDWFDKEIDSSIVMENVDPYIEEIEDIMDDVNQSLKSELGLDNDEIEQFREDAIYDLYEALSEEIDETGEVETNNNTEEIQKSDEILVEAEYLGDTTQGYGYGLTAIKIVDPASPASYYEVEDGKKIIGVEVIISNVSGDICSTDLSYATLVDSEGFTYSADWRAIENEIPSLYIDDGEQVKGWIGFEVPKDIPEIKSLKYEFFQLTSFDSYKLSTSLIPTPENYEPNQIELTVNMPKMTLGESDGEEGRSLSAINIADPATPGSRYENRQGFRLYGVEVILSNESSEESFFIDLNEFSLVDEKGFMYSAEWGYTVYQIESGELEKGEKRRGWISFVIPDDSIPLYIKYPIEYFSEIYLVVGVKH